MTTYTWKIDMMHTMNADGVDGAVTEVHWSKHGLHQNGIKTRIPNMTKFKVSDIQVLKESGGFTPFERLTEAQVLSWIQDKLSQQEKDFLDLSLEQSYQFQSNPITGKSVDNDTLPWNI